MKRGTYLWLGLVAFVVALAADQASKWYITDVLAMFRGQNIDLFPTISLTFTTNPGITFGLLQGDSPLHIVVLAGLALVVSVVLVMWLWRATSRLGAVALGAVAGGAIGNVIDRLHYGSVVDFIRFHVGTWSWYIFNVADAAIVCGVIALVLEGWLLKQGAVRAREPS